MGTVDSADWRTSSYSGTNGDCVEIGTWRKSSYSGTNGNCLEIATWRKSTRSDTSGACVEVGGAARAVLVRDTNDRDGAVLAVSAQAWGRFIAIVK